MELARSRSAQVGRLPVHAVDQPFVVDHSKFAGAFGAKSTPHEEAIRETVAWYRARSEPGGSGKDPATPTPQD